GVRLAQLEADAAQAQPSRHDERSAAADEGVKHDHRARLHRDAVAGLPPADGGPEAVDVGRPAEALDPGWIAALARDEVVPVRAEAVAFVLHATPFHDARPRRAAAGAAALLRGARAEQGQHEPRWESGVEI